jgi:hypothetical protein
LLALARPYVASDIGGAYPWPAGQRGGTGPEVACPARWSGRLAVRGAPPVVGAASPAAKERKAEPRTEDAVRAVAQEEVDTYASGDYGGAWDLWTDSAKKLISRADYEKLFELCPPVAAGIPFTIEKIKLAPDRNSATVRYSRSIAVMSFRYVYEGGRWRYVPEARNQRDYRTKSVEELAASRRKDGACERES